jgi:uracil phosphoribosyltransferase
MIMDDIAKLAHINQHPLVKTKLSELRDKKTDSKRFRELVREIGTLLGYEATRDLQIKDLPNVQFYSAYNYIIL